jgi:hypothetical protein
MSDYAQPVQRRYRKAVVPTRTLQVGQTISMPGLHLAVDLIAVRHREDGITELTFDYQATFHRHRKTIRRKTSGVTTIFPDGHTPIED